MSRICPSAVFCFRQPWQFLINFFYIRLWKVLREEMRKACMKTRSAFLEHIIQFHNNGVSQCQISSSACRLMILSFYCHAIPHIQSAKILTVKKWMATLYLLLIVWLNMLCVNTFLVMLFAFVAFIFRWLRVLLSPFAPDHIQQSLFHRKGRFIVLGSKMSFSMSSSGGRTERPD